jgi:fructose-1-phosphate kinase PfkB-like protein
MPVKSVDEAKVAVGKLLDKNCKLVIITLGALGAVFASQGNYTPIHVPTKTVKPTDSTVSPCILIISLITSFYHHILLANYPLMSILFYYSI